jgi:hypothetical protein
MMSIALLEKQVELLKERRDAAENTRAEVPGCKLMAPNAQTITLIKERPDLGEAAKLVVKLLAEETWAKSIEVDVTVDPDTGDNLLSITIVSDVSGKDARKRLDVFLDTKLPDSVQAVEDEIVFSILEGRAA